MIDRVFQRRIDGASLAVFRILFGALLCVAAVRFVAKGTVRAHYIEPHVFFPICEWTWLKPLPGGGMYAVWGALALLGFTISIGLFTRVSAAIFCLFFAYAHSIDKTNFLNHYYLVTLLTGLLVILPTDGLWSVDAWRRGKHCELIPEWALWLLRFQIGCVYFFGGVAKLKSDWLFRAQPLRIWLPSAQDTPLLGPFLRLHETPWIMSWTGAIYDLSVPFLLLMTRTRPFAYLAVVFFHVATGMLFNIGMFPLFMVGASLLFLPPSWPRKLLGSTAPESLEKEEKSLPPWGRWLLMIYVSIQILVPLRHWLYPGNVLWTEDGFRYAWNVMLIEKTGSVEFTIVDCKTKKREVIRNRDYLTPWQEKAMAAQPDLLLAFAHHLARARAIQGHPMEVYADAWITLNGRSPARLVAQDLDLSQVEEGWGPRRWILPLP